MKAQISNDEIRRMGLPQTGRLKDGRVVSGYDKLDDATLADEGWVDVIDEQPVYDPETEDLTHKGHRYDPAVGKVVTDYEVSAKPPPPPPEPDYDKQFRDAVTAATTLQQLKDALLGSKGPGAQPKTGRPE